MTKPFAETMRAILEARLAQRGIDPDQLARYRDGAIGILRGFSDDQHFQSTFGRAEGAIAINETRGYLQSVTAKFITPEGYAALLAFNVFWNEQGHELVQSSPRLSYEVIIRNGAEEDVFSIIANGRSVEVDTARFSETLAEAVEITAEAGAALVEQRGLQSTLDALKMLGP